jgi:hypothetical protein
LNERIVGTGRGVMTNYEARLGNQFVSSDADKELIFNCKFNGDVKLKGILCVTKYKSHQPKLLKIYINPASDVDFGNIASIKPTQQFVLQHDPTGVYPYLVRGIAFNSVTHISIHISELLHPGAVDVDDKGKLLPELDEDVGNEIMVNFLGLLGSYSGSIRVPPKTAYELAPQPGDHQQTEITKHSMGFGL